MTEQQITQAMIFANNLAVARVKRYAANTRNGGAVALAKADEDVDYAVMALRTYLETFKCPTQLSSTPTATAS